MLFLRAFAICYLTMPVAYLLKGLMLFTTDQINGLIEFLADMKFIVDDARLRHADMGGCQIGISHVHGYCLNGVALSLA